MQDDRKYKHLLFLEKENSEPSGKNRISPKQF